MDSCERYQKPIVPTTKLQPRYKIEGKRILVIFSRSLLKEFKNKYIVLKE